MPVEGLSENIGREVRRTPPNLHALCYGPVIHKDEKRERVRTIETRSIKAWLGEAQRIVNGLSSAVRAEEDDLLPSGWRELTKAKDGSMGRVLDPLLQFSSDTTAAPNGKAEASEKGRPNTTSGA